MQLRQKLTFQMIQSLKLLQVNTLQLEQLLKTELEQNPVLEASDELDTEVDDTVEQNTDTEEKDTTGEEKELEVAEDGIDWEEYLEEGFDMGGRISEEREQNHEHYEPVSVAQTTLDEHLANLLSERDLPEDKALLVRFLINCLDHDGYLRLPLESLAEYIGSQLPEVEEALTIIQSLEPKGIGARNLRECLMLQLHARGLDDSPAMRIVRDHWDLFEKVRIPDLARALDVGPRDVQDAIDVIKTLHPRPGYLVNPERSTVIVPDLIVENVDGEFVVMLNDRSVPALHINKSYADLVRRGSSAQKDVKQFVRDKLNSATWLIRSIEQRKNTMIRVMHAIIEKQRTFFEKGPPNLMPLKLQDVADIVEMHISTISRVTTNKYVQTPHGIFELKYFFTEAMGQDAQGDDVSAARIKNRIKQLVETENSARPLSDQKIADVLKKENLLVARRTVAKYREQLKVLPARLRQKYE